MLELLKESSNRHLLVNDYKKGTKLKVIAKLINENDWIHSDPMRQDFVRPNGELEKFHISYNTESLCVFMCRLLIVCSFCWHKAMRELR